MKENEEMNQACPNCGITIQDEYDRTGDEGYKEIAQMVTDCDWFCSEWCANEFRKNN